MQLSELQEKRITILGLGVNNYALTEYLLSHGCEVTIRDRNPSVKETFLKKHPEWDVHTSWEIMPDITEKLQNTDIVFRTPFIPFMGKNLQKAKKRGLQVWSQTKLFFDLCPAQIIGVTGTKGKGTTSTLIYQILRAEYTKGQVYLAGNIGIDPFTFLDRLTADDIVILELSSFQTQDLHKSPHVAVLLHVDVDHLDHHANIEEYRSAKKALILNQSEQDVAIINVDYPEMKPFFREAKAKRYMVTRHTPARQSAWAERLDGREIVFFQMESELQSFDVTERKLLGEHNLENILPAVLVGCYYGISTETIRKVVTHFPGLEHRLARVGEYNGVTFYDDSIATTPESCLVALEAFTGQRVHLLAGGGDKGASFTALSKEIIQRCVTVSLLPGAGTKALHTALTQSAKHQSNCSILDRAQDPVMETILSGIQPHLLSGDVVLLSPAAKSDPPFANYKERGEAFVHAIQARYTNHTV